MRGGDAGLEQQLGWERNGWKNRPYISNRKPGLRHRGEWGDGPGDRLSQTLGSLIMRWSESVRKEVSVLFGFWWGSMEVESRPVDGKWENGPKRAGIFSGCLEILSLTLTLFYSSVNFNRDLCSDYHN